MILWNLIPDERADDVVRHDVPAVLDGESSRLEMGELGKHDVKGQVVGTGDEDYDEIKGSDSAGMRVEPV